MVFAEKVAHREHSRCDKVMLVKLKKSVKTSQCFWKYRHLVDFSIWSRYLESANRAQRAFYPFFVNRERITSIFEFGCASGPNLRRILSESDLDLFFGVDVNTKAIQVAGNQEWSCATYFRTELDTDILRAILLEHDKTEFDLGIYDRVLYLLDIEETNRHFESVAPILSTVVIDDFHADSFESNGVYCSKNYEKILSRFGFVLSSSDSSEHPIRDDFFRSCAKRLVFRRVA
jgi:hypothetical protein